MADVNSVMLYILIGAVAGIVYSLRRIFILEEKIDSIVKRKKKRR
jgi:hypothetical protein|tara:strand:+ start:52 stop:186 length:135 start_codon:yes stop_codon:yes gene_type:complete